MNDGKYRFIFETSDRRKKLFLKHLSKYGSNPTEWFNARSEIVIKQYLSELQNMQIHSPSLLQELSNVESLFKVVKNIDWDFTDNETTYLTHDIHPYPAKYIPHIPHTLISALSLPGELIWDPFGGSGTTALEALLLNRRCICTDANPIAEIIGKAKTSTLTEKEQLELGVYTHWLYDILDQEYSSLGEPADVPEIPNIQKWFHPNAILELSFIKHSIQNLSSNAKIIALVALSRTVAKISNQESETRYASKPKDINKWATIQYFVGDLDIVITKVLACGSILKGRTAEFATLNVAEPLCQNSAVKENQIDLIVTSPPYANVTDYHLYHRFRMFWLGFNPVAFGKIEIGSHLRHQKEKTGFTDYIAEMSPCIENCYRALKPGRYAAFVLGDSIFEKIQYNTADAYKTEAEKIGFEIIGTIPRNLPNFRRSFETPARRATKENILLLRKPPKSLEVTLREAPYKLWKYEKHLLIKELSVMVGSVPLQIGKKDWAVETDCYNLDKLNKLAFIHNISSGDLAEYNTWQSLAENGEAQDNISQRKESKYITHGIHEYKGKFYPQLCKSLLNISEIQPGATVLDPFMGSGTTVLEAYLSGYKAYGCDMNPLAVKISKAKTDVLEMDPSIVLQSISSLLVDFGNYNNSSEFLFKTLPTEAINELIKWFPEPVINKLGYILERINCIPDVRLRNFVQVILSNIVRNVSQQDPQDLRIRRRKIPIVDAPVIEIFSTNLEKQFQKLEKYYQIRNYIPGNLFKPHIWEGDSRKLESYTINGLSNESVDLIVTSPPYATALPYIDTNRLSLLILMNMASKQRDPIEENLIGSREIKNSLKHTIEDKILRNDYANIISPYAKSLISQLYYLNNKNEVGFRRKNMASLIFNYFSSMSQYAKIASMLIKPGGSMFMVVGDNVTTSGNEKIPIKTTQMLKETMELNQFKLNEQVSISVTTDNMKHINNSIKDNLILWFKKQ